MKKPMIDTMMRSKFDNLYTPKEAIYPLLKYLPVTTTFWECTDSGKSEITRVLKESGRKVLSSDVITGFDFLIKNQFESFDVIVTNPPYSLKDNFFICY